MKVSKGGRPLPRILHGHHEAIFDELPGNVLGNLHQRHSENALVWNLMYPLVREGLELARLHALPPLWGTPVFEPESDPLTAYFWGYDRQGKRLPGLDAVLDQIDGPGPQTEVDLILRGHENLIVVEAKYGSRLGRCARYDQAACPAQHPAVERGAACRYWEVPAARFDALLRFPDPSTTEGPPPCHRHYQLGRTLLVGEALGEEIGLRSHLWLVTPRRAWPRLQRDWLNFADRVKDAGRWKRLRVLAWEEIARLGAGGLEAG